MTYRVIITTPAEDSMYQRVREIAEDAGSLEVAMTWLEDVLQHTQRLAEWPRSAEVAEESVAFAYELRKLVVGKYLVLYRVEDETKQVIIMGFRHGAKLNTDFGDLS